MAPISPKHVLAAPIIDFPHGTILIPAVTPAAEISGRTFTVSMSFAGASALSIPSALTVAAGTVIIINKSGSAGAVTVSATAGNVAGGATYTAIDALNDTAILIPVGANWLIAGSAIA